MHALAQARRALAAVDLRPGLAIPEVHARLAQGARLRETGQRILAFYLTEMEERGLHQATGHSSTANFAEDRLGLDTRRARELITVGRTLLTLPAIDRAFCEHRLGWSKLLQLAKVASPEHEAAWLERALASTCRELALEVRCVPAGRPPRKAGSSKGLPEVRFSVRARVSALTHQKLELVKRQLSAERGQPIDDAECLDVLAELFLGTEEDGSLPGRTRVSTSLYRIILRPETCTPEDGTPEDGNPDDRPLLVDTELGPVPIDGGACDPAITRVRSECVRCDGTNSGDGTASGGGKLRDRKTPPALRRRVLARDGQRCRCCGSRHRLMAHHIRYRSHGGATHAWNLITLCVSCHSMVHAGLLVLRGKRAGSIRFVDAGGKPLHEAGTLATPADLLPLAQVADAPAENRPPGDSALPESAAVGTISEAPPTPQPSKPQPMRTACAGFVGQDDLLERLDRTARGARARGRCFPHTLFVGPPGTGKTTLSRGIAACVGARFIERMGPLLQDTAELTRVIESLGKGDILFVDEIHAVPRTVLESLYQAMGAGRFTLVAATTEDGELPHALRSRFGLREVLDFYAEPSLAALIETTARAEDFHVEPAAAACLARSARGTPREALRLLDRALDEAASRGSRRLGTGAAAAALKRLGFDPQGLDPTEQRYLALLRESHQPVALGRLARMLGTSARTLLEHVEPFLFRRGLVTMTAQGRTARAVQPT